MGRIGPRWDRLAVVAGGVTTTQGAWESHAQDEGPEISSSNQATHTEVIDLMADVTAELGHLNELAKGDPNKRFDRLYRLLKQSGFLAIAKGRIAGNKGAKTPGVDGQTMTDMNSEEITRLSEELKSGNYQPKPVRRVYIPKKNGKLRPLGIPIWHSHCTSYSRVWES